MSKAVPYQSTIHARDTCLCLHAQRAARALVRLFDTVLAPAGMTSGQFSLLNALNRPTPPTLGSVATLLAMDRTTLTANLKPLCGRGLVAILVDDRDRRSRLLRLTEAGEAALAVALPIWRGTHAEIEAKLVGADPAGLRAGLTELARV